LEHFAETATEKWNTLIRDLPGAHALQTSQWGAVKSRFGWEPHQLLWRGNTGEVTAAALVLQRRLSSSPFAPHLGVMYTPRGPLLDWQDPALVDQVLRDLEQFARKNNAIFIKIDPDLPLGFGVPGEATAKDHPIGLRVQQTLSDLGWTFSDEQIQFKNTVVIDLRQDKEAMLMRMKSKTRYNIRLAQRRGVTVRVGSLDDVNRLYRMYAHTAVRDDFLIRKEAYYQSVWRTFIAEGMAEPLIAEVEGQPVGAVVIFRFAGRAWYFYGMSLDEHREKMFNYRLQWEAMLHAKAAGCHAYDMWGAPDEFHKEDPLWGVYRFKGGFCGQVVRTLGAWDFPTRPLIYRLYNQILPRILGWMRKRGKTATQRRLNT